MASPRKNWPIGQCPICLGWGEKRQYTTCGACAKWRRAFPRQQRCRRCGHDNHVNNDGLCRGCLQILRTDDPDWLCEPAPHRSLQLALIVPGLRVPKAAPLTLHAKRANPNPATTAVDGRPDVQHQRGLTPREPKPKVSLHLVDPAQPELFHVRRDWQRFAAGTSAPLPALTPGAEALLELFHQHAREHGWHASPRNSAARSLRIVLGWLGADAPIREEDIRALTENRRNAGIRRVLQFLGAHNMLVTDPEHHGEAAQRAVEARITSLPTSISNEIRCWVKVMRGQGRLPHPQFPYATIRSYLNCLRPVLMTWTQQVSSLREITPDDIQAALDDRPPVTARNLLSALHSLFRALKQERVIFRDPTRGISLPAIRRLPAPIPTDQLRGLIDRTDGAMAKARRRADRHPWTPQAGNLSATARRPRPCRRALARPPRPSPSHRLPRRTDPHTRRLLALRTPRAVEPNR